MSEWLFVHRLCLFGGLEWLTFLLAACGAVLSVIAFIEATVTLRAVHQWQLGKGPTLMAWKNRRIGWVMFVVFALFAVIYGVAIGQPPTTSQLDPSPQTILFYVGIAVIVAVLDYLRIRNYIDYRVAYTLNEMPERHLPVGDDATGIEKES